jgi:peptidoglycan/xylan/chitin deacetylase (PgdA/CDA1 family)
MNNPQYVTKWRMGIPSPWRSWGTPRHLLRHLVVSTLAAVNSKGDPRFLRFLYCHYVFDDQRERFEKLMMRLMQAGTFVNTDTAIEMVEGTREIDKGYFHLSFDDGFLNVITNALPILQRLNVPSLIFVPTIMMDATYEQVREYCLTTTEYAGVIQMSTWDALKTAVAAGWDVGSHTRAHARLSEISVDAARLREEIEGSKYDIENRLGTECKYFAWPYGRMADVDRTVITAIRTAGYRAAFGAFRGTVAPSLTDEFSLPRHHFEVQWPLSHTEYFARGKMERWWELHS